MTHAYARTYLADAEDCLGCAFDYAVHDCGVAGNTFATAFVHSGLARLFETGNPSIVSGMSGIELAYAALSACGMLTEQPEPTYARNLSPEYWAGWALAQYQWDRAIRFVEVFARISFSEISELYTPLHEADISVFMEHLDQMLLKSTPKQTNLARIRKQRGLTQGELARASGVGLKSIQAYEQRFNDINKASAEYLSRFAWVLGCSMSDLLELSLPMSIEYDSRAGAS